MKKLICTILLTILLIPTSSYAAVTEIFLSPMQLEDFNDDFKTIGKKYMAFVLDPDDDLRPTDTHSYSLEKSETNDSVTIFAGGYMGGGQKCYETLLNAVEAYFDAEAAQFVRENFDPFELNMDYKPDEQIGNFTLKKRRGNNTSGFEITVKREPIFVDLVDYEIGWEANAVIELYGEGIIKGVGSNMFDPYSKITRADFAVIFARMIGIADYSIEYNGTFSDVPQDEYYASAAEALAEMGYVLGYDGRFEPHDNISFQDMFVVAYRYLTDNDLLPEYKQNITITNHIDSDYDDYAKEAINELYAKGKINRWYLDAPREPGNRVNVAYFLNGIREYIK
ncbi:MAG: S-layer homology domain-containing protein [Oscillospiraceae bacterium]|nr:S-layer homology domain-containing protein [Oscillospiraceae bacterium]